MYISTKVDFDEDPRGYPQRWPASVNFRFPSSQLLKPRVDIPKALQGPYPQGRVGKRVLRIQGDAMASDQADFMLAGTRSRH